MCINGVYVLPLADLLGTGWDELLSTCCSSNGKTERSREGGREREREGETVRGK